MAASALAPIVLESIGPENFDEEGLEKLRFLFSDTLLFAALDLIDRESVIKYKTPWGGMQYEVHGSTANYSVFPELPGPSPDKKSSVYCTCPAFAYSVLLSRTQIMCKHLLATLLAERLAKCTERSIQPNDIAALAIRQCTS